MGGASLPPGFRFHPTDEELVGYYLRRKVEGLDFALDVIPVIDLYKFDPWELPEKSFLPNRDMQWFFFCPRDRKYLNGSRTNRATKAGYWKATGKDRKVVCGSSIWAHRKTLVFYQGRAPLGNRTNWFMHEYRLCDNDSCQETHTSLGAFALCRVIKKNGNRRKISGSTVDSLNGKSVMSNYTGNTSMEISNEPPRAFSNISSQDSGHSSPMTSPYSPVPDFGLGPVLESNPEKLSVASNLILDSSKEHTQVQEMPPEIFRQCGIPSSMSSWRPYDHQEISSCLLFSNFTGEHSDDHMQFGYSNGSHNRLNESEGIADNSYDLTSSLRDSKLF